LAAESTTGPVNFHPNRAREDSVGESEGQATEDPKSQVKKRKRNKKKKGKGQEDTNAEGRQNAERSSAAQDDTAFTPLKDKIPDSFFEDQDSSEDEGMPDYKIGGYHPVHVGEILLDRYVIIQKLGWGHFSTVWLTKDLKHNSYVAIKVQKSAQHYLEAAYDEVEILDKVARNWKSKDWARSIGDYY
jgi:serine/threonine-protein kinase SRPK3